MYYFNDRRNFWEMVPALINKTNNTVTFTTNHFSIYTIGELPEDSLAEENQDETSSQGSGGQSTRTDRYSHKLESVVLDDQTSAFVALQQELIALEKDWRAGNITNWQVLLRLQKIIQQLYVHDGNVADESQE